MSIEEPSSPQQQSPIMIIQGVLRCLELDETEVAFVLFEDVEEITIIEVADELSQDWGLDVQVPVEVESKAKKVA